MVTTTAQPTVTAIQYTVSLLPEDHPECPMYEITVEYRGNELWAVTRGRRALGADGVWDWESNPGERTNEWLSTHRFDLDTALSLAREAVHKIRVNGETAADILARQT